MQLKGCKWSKVKAEVDQMIEDLHLSKKRKTYSKNLSGGMKRKLSVGIALIAGSKVGPTFTLFLEVISCEAAQIKL